MQKAQGRSKFGMFERQENIRFFWSSQQTGNYETFGLAGRYEIVWGL